MTTICNVGFYHPSYANWSYNVWVVIDDTGAKLYKETFGGDTRMIEKMSKEGIEVVEKRGIMYSGVFKGRDVENMPDIESYTGRNF